eukprot:TRINITY_DN24079_c0_g1_i1.p1 TRINITY_DN24079_c0_g1~~TRINITY_DN24079_c0_g1_i1.p1  ORF type:complete len:801 (+),score=149.50 TRINITY_DN24079_c0_g1_i1:137-2539(+)
MDGRAASRQMKEITHVSLKASASPQPKVGAEEAEIASSRMPRDRRAFRARLQKNRGTSQPRKPGLCEAAKPGAAAVAGPTVACVKPEPKNSKPTSKQGRRKSSRPPSTMLVMAMPPRAEDASSRGPASVAAPIGVAAVPVVQAGSKEETMPGRATTRARHGRLCMHWQKGECRQYARCRFVHASYNEASETAEGDNPVATVDASLGDGVTSAVRAPGEGRCQLASTTTSETRLLPASGSGGSDVAVSSSSESYGASAAALDSHSREQPPNNVVMAGKQEDHSVGADVNPRSEDVSVAPLAGVPVRHPPFVRGSVAMKWESRRHRRGSADRAVALLAATTSKKEAVCTEGGSAFTATAAVSHRSAVVAAASAAAVAGATTAGAVDLARTAARAESRHAEVSSAVAAAAVQSSAETTVATPLTRPTDVDRRKRGTMRSREVFCWGEDVRALRAEATLAQPLLLFEALSESLPPPGGRQDSGTESSGASGVATAPAPTSVATPSTRLTDLALVPSLEARETSPATATTPRMSKATAATAVAATVDPSTPPPRRCWAPPLPPLPAVLTCPPGLPPPSEPWGALLPSLIPSVPASVFVASFKDEGTQLRSEAPEFWPAFPCGAAAVAAMPRNSSAVCSIDEARTPPKTVSRRHSIPKPLLANMAEVGTDSQQHAQPDKATQRQQQHGRHKGTLLQAEKEQAQRTIAPSDFSLAHGLGGVDTPPNAVAQRQQPSLVSVKIAEMEAEATPHQQCQHEKPLEQQILRQKVNTATTGGDALASDRSEQLRAAIATAAAAVSGGGLREWI